MSSADTRSAVADPSVSGAPSKHQIDARFVGDVSPFMHSLACAARRYVHNPRDAEDLVQETLLKAYIAFHSFRAGSNMKAWLFQIMQRTWIDDYRATRRRPQEVLTERFTDSFLFRRAGYVPHASYSADTDMLEAELGEELREALRSLAEPLRLVVYYADVEGRTHSDIAVILDIPSGTVTSRIYRARRRLRAQLTEAYEAKG